MGPNVLLLIRKYISCMHFSWESTDNIISGLLENKQGPLINRVVIIEITPKKIVWCEKSAKM